MAMMAHAARLFFDFDVMLFPFLLVIYRIYWVVVFESVDITAQILENVSDLPTLNSKMVVYTTSITSRKPLQK